MPEKAYAMLRIIAEENERADFVGKLIAPGL
jgi:hypothetical protein